MAWSKPISPLLYGQNAWLDSNSEKGREGHLHKLWGEVGRRLDWIVPYTQVKDTSFDKHDFRIRWYADGELNASVNCLDRHLGARTAIIWESDDPQVYDLLEFDGEAPAGSNGHAGTC